MVDPTTSKDYCYVKIKNVNTLNVTAKKMEP